MIRDVIDIGQVIRKAAVFKLKQAMEQRVNETELLRAVEQLFELLNERRVDYVLVGGVALLQICGGKHTALQDFAGRKVRCATVDGLLLLKLYALPSLYRQGNFALVGLYENDIATLTQGYAPNIQTLLAELAPHVSDTDLASLRDIIAEIQQRIERFKKGLS